MCFAICKKNAECIIALINGFDFANNLAIFPRMNLSLKYFRLVCSLSIVVMVSSSCDFKARQQELEKRRIELDNREQGLILREKAVQFKEDSLQLLLTRKDSSIIIVDSISLLPPALHGEWITRSVCTETNCSGSAVGDTRTDTWLLGSRDSSIYINSVNSNQITRVYTGKFYRSNLIKASTVSTANPQEERTAIFNVTLNEVSATRIKGTREIIQPDGCKIVYSVEMTKK